MRINKVTSYDEALRLAVVQDVTADDVGKDASGSPIVLDLHNWRNQCAQLNLKIKSAAANTNVLVQVQSSDDPTFGTGVYTDEVLRITETAAVATDKAYATTGFAVKRRYVRLRFDHNTGSLTDVTAWLSLV